MRVSFRHDLPDLERDFKSTIREVRPAVRRGVQTAANEGAKRARKYARRRSGTHGRHYPSSITLERLGFWLYEYGPDPDKKQGGMAFESGSRNQPPHPDIAQSTDGLSRELQGRVGLAVRGTWRV